VPLHVSIEDLAVMPLEGPTLISFLKAMEFNTLTRRVASDTETEVKEVEAADVEVNHWEAPKDDPVAPSS
jgi:DNA polymerase-1